MATLKKEVTKPIFWNYPLDKGKLKSFVSWFLKQHGEKKTLELLEQLKVLGFGYATEAGISLGIEDLKIPPHKLKMISRAQSMVSQFFFLHKKGKITNIEKTQGFIEIWNEVNESLKDEVVSYFEKTDILNPVYMMAFSGARGNLSQVRQLVGMRGLMSDPQGKIIDFPILSNFREGLTLTEYLISTYGARKGIVDTALRTATAGYLTRRLVDVAQHVIVSKLDCGTQRGIFLFDMKDEGKTIYAFQNRLTGRVLGQDIYKTGSKGELLQVAHKNQEIDGRLAALIAKVTKKALVRSPLTCENIKRVCQLCYGWSLATSRLVSIGEAVGVIAGQSIGEPGTQLTMRTFHTGGVFAGNISEQINAPFSCIVEYTTPMSGSLVRLPRGTQGVKGSVGIAFLTKASGTMVLKSSGSPYEEKTNLKKEKDSQSYSSVQTYNLPAFTILFARHGEWVPKQSLLAQVSAVTPGQKNTQISEQTVYSALEGEVLYKQLDLMEDIDEKYGERVSKSEDWAKVWVLSAKITQTPLSGFNESNKHMVKDVKSNLNKNTNMLKVQDFISRKTVIQEIDWFTPLKSSIAFSQIGNVTHNFYSKRRSETYSFRPKLQRISQILWGNSWANRPKQKPLMETSFAVLKPSFDNISKNTLLAKIPNDENKNAGFEKKEQLNCQIFQNLQIRSKFLENPSIKQKRTFVQYYFEQNKLLKVSRFLKNTQIFLPILQPGTFTNWYKVKKTFILGKLQKKNAKHFFQTLENEKPSVFFLSVKSKFLKKYPTNYAQPLILNNQIPFSLKLKTFKSLQQKNQNSALLKSSFILNTNLSFKENFRNAFILNSRKVKLEKNSKLIFNKMSKKELYQIENNTKKTISLSIKKQSNTAKHKNREFQDLFMKKCLLTFPILSPQFNKLGYSGSTQICSNKKDKFFSFLPLKAEAFTSSNFRSLENSRLNTENHLNLNRAGFNLNQKLQNSLLQNTNNWQPKPTTGFGWYPGQTSIPSSFICLVHSSAFNFNFFQQIISQNLKNPKQGRLWQKKALKILNLAQSQVFKKMKTQPIKAFSNLKVKSSKIFFSAPLQNQISKQALKNVDQSSDQCYPVYKIKKESALSLKTLNLNKFHWHNSRNKKNFLTFFSTSKYGYYQKFKDKSGQNLLQKINKKESMVTLAKFSLLGKKKNLSLKKLKLKKSKHLKMQLTENQKTSLSFKEMFYLPQQTYMFNTWARRAAVESKSTGKQPGQVSSLTNISRTLNQSFYLLNAGSKNRNVQRSRQTSIVIKQNEPSFLLSNHQGSLKKFEFTKGYNLENKSFSNFGSIINEGILTIQSRKKHKNQNTPKRKQKSNPFHSTFFMTDKQSKEMDPLNLKNTGFRIAEKFSQVHLYSLKQKFLHYIRTKFVTKKKSEPSAKCSQAKSLLCTTSSFKNAVVSDLNENKKFENAAHLICSKNQKNYWDYVPFVKNSSVLNFRTNLDWTIPKWKNEKFAEKKQVQVNFKPGWVYQSSNYSTLFSSDNKLLKAKKKKIIDLGKTLIDDIHLDVQKVLFEPIFVSKKTVEEKEISIKEKSFVPSKWYQNKNCRFFKVPTQNPPKKEFNLDDLKPVKNLYLIRPFQNQRVPGTQEMKTRLYEKMKISESAETGFSYKIYKNYFFEELNPQKVNIQFLSKIAKLDFELKETNVFQKPNLTRWLNFFRKSKSRKRSIKRQRNKISKTNSKKTKLMKAQKTVSKSKGLTQKKQTKIFKFKTQQQSSKRAKFWKRSNSLQKVIKSIYVQKEHVILKPKERKLFTLFKQIHVPLYFSNEGLNLAPLEVVYKLSNPEWKGYSFPSLSLNQEKNLLFLNSGKNQTEKALLQHYLNLMLERNSNASGQGKKGNFVPLVSHVEGLADRALELRSGENLTKEVFRTKHSSQFFPVIGPNSLEKRKLKKQILKSNNQKRQIKISKIMGSYLPYFYSTAKFEFAVNMHYNFFLNARLRGIGGWKQSFEESWKLNTLNLTKTKNENFRLQRFFTKSTQKTLLSFQYLPVLRNFFHLKNLDSGAQKQNAIGRTCFYSPYEGLLLKDYSLETNTTNLEKTYNIHLDGALLKERQEQKLILTKADLFVLNFPVLKDEVQISTENEKLFFKLKTENSDKSKHLQEKLKNFKNFDEKQSFFNQSSTHDFLKENFKRHGKFQQLEEHYFRSVNFDSYKISNFSTTYENKTYKLKEVEFGFTTSLLSESLNKDVNSKVVKEEKLVEERYKLKIGNFFYAGDSLYGDICLPRAGQLIHLNSKKATFRKADYFSLSPKAILHTYNGHTIQVNAPVMTLPFETLKTGDIVQGIPKVEQYLEARTTIQGRLFLNSLPMLLYAIYRRYLSTLEMEKAARQSFLKIQQILVDGVQRVYRSQGVGITDKHLEVIVRQMTSKVKIIYGGQTGFFPGELVDLDFVERVNQSLMVKVIYEPVVLGITRASLEVDSFLSAASFQQTTKVLTRAAIENKRDFLKGLKENLLVGNLLPAGTGYVVPISNPI